jgi:pilus assembly protein Flp/PilA
MDRRISLQNVIRYLASSCARTERGASLVEYALLVAFIAIACLLSVALFGGAVSHKFSATGSGLS